MVPYVGDRGQEQHANRRGYFGADCRQRHGGAHNSFEVCQQIDLIKFNDGERYDKIHKGYNIASISDKSSKFIFLAIFQREYPSYKIFSLLEEINNKVNKLVYTDIEEKKNNISIGIMKFITDSIILYFW